MRRDLIRMKRLSWDYQILEEDARQMDPEHVWTRITNLDECKDGLYTVGLCNQSRDWESGYLDDSSPSSPMSNQPPHNHWSDAIFPVGMVIMTLVAVGMLLRGLLILAGIVQP